MSEKKPVSTCCGWGACKCICQDPHVFLEILLHHARNSPAFKGAIREILRGYYDGDSW